MKFTYIILEFSLLRGPIPDIIFTVSYRTSKLGLKSIVLYQPASASLRRAFINLLLHSAAAANGRHPEGMKDCDTTAPDASSSSFRLHCRVIGLPATLRDVCQR